jgi:integrase
VAVCLKGYTGMRWGELVGLETEFVRGAQVRIEWQLYELDTGGLHRCPPKDDSYRTIDLPAPIADMLSDHLARAERKPCACHTRRYVFSGHGAATGVVQHSGPKLSGVARRAGVSSGTVSNVLNRPGTVPETTRIKVATPISDLGYVRRGPAGERAPHWRRNTFATWLFQPAATGWYPRKAPHDAHPVPLLAEPWPRGAGARPERCRAL